MEQALYMVAHQNWRSTLEYDFCRKGAIVTKGFQWMKLFITLRCLFPDCGKFIFFGEGNTRTTAVFFIKYLRTLGFSVTNSIFAENAWYF